MRLWTVHPKYLDTKGLLAVWREGLLAQKVLQNLTVGYGDHPQLRRFLSTSDPPAAIATYLRCVYDESVRRGYYFQEEKIAPTEFQGQIACTRGQLLYEWGHLQEKLRERDPARYEATEGIEVPEGHPLFEIIDGEVESWEIIEKPGRK